MQTFSTPLGFSFDNGLDFTQLRLNLSLPELQPWNLSSMRCTLGRFSAICIILVACASGVNPTVNRNSTRASVLTMRTRTRTHMRLMASREGVLATGVSYWCVLNVVKRWLCGLID